MRSIALLRHVFKVSLAAVLLHPAFAETTFASQYPGAWRTDFHNGIAKTLVVSKVGGCGEFVYKAAIRAQGEYLVYCTRDGKNWTAYLVWPTIGKVLGPSKISNEIAPPK